MCVFEALAGGRPLGATQACDGARLFQVLRHHLQHAGDLIRHRHALHLQDLKKEREKKKAVTNVTGPQETFVFVCPQTPS